MRSRPLFALASAGALLTLTLVACSGQTSETVAGEVVAAPPSFEIIGDFGFVQIPTGRIEVVVGEPRGGDVAAEEAGDGQDHEPPTGGSWIPVHVAHDPFGALGVPVGITGGSPQPAQVALVVDGKTINLGAPYRVVGDDGTADSGLDNVWVSVGERPAEVDSVEVAVTYDGLTQTLDPKAGTRQAGAAGPLYDDAAEASSATCPPDGLDDGEVMVDLSCAIGPAQRTPYLPGSGWADEGRSWLVVDMAASVDEATAGGTAYDVVRIEPTLTVDGDGPLPPDGRFGDVRRDPQRVSGTWAFDAPADGAMSVSLELDLVLRKRDAEDPGPGTRRVTVEQTADLAAG